LKVSADGRARVEVVGAGSVRESIDVDIPSRVAGECVAASRFEQRSEAELKVRSWIGTRKPGGPNARGECWHQCDHTYLRLLEAAEQKVLDVLLRDRNQTRDVFQVRLDKGVVDT